MSYKIGDKISAPIISKEDGEIIDIISETNGKELLAKFYDLTEKEDFQLLNNCNSGRLVKLALNSKGELDVGLLSTGWNEYNYEIVDASIMKVKFGGFIDELVLAYIKGKNNNLDGLFIPVSIKYSHALFNKYKGK